LTTNLSCQTSLINQCYFTLNHLAVPEEHRNKLRCSSAVRKFILLAGLAPRPSIKELRQVRGNDVSSTEPRSGEGSPLDWAAG
jgi:hypothetical protein